MPDLIYHQIFVTPYDVQKGPAVRLNRKIDLAHHPLARINLKHDACGTGMLVAKSKDQEPHILRRGLIALSRMSHRGGDVGDSCSDGSGVMLEIPWAIVLDGCEAAQKADTADLIVGMFFLAASEDDRKLQLQLLMDTAARLNLETVHTRLVPVDPSVLPEQSRTNCPCQVQIVYRTSAGSGPGLRTPHFTSQHSTTTQTQRLAHVRLGFLAAIQNARHQSLYSRQGISLVSLSDRTVVYKALVNGSRLAAFYRDLADHRVHTRFVLFHQRFATNTHPDWELAQPFDGLAHNGEINTIRANAENLLLRLQELSIEDSTAADTATPSWLGGEQSDSKIMDLALTTMLAQGLPLAAAASSLMAPLNQDDAPAKAEDGAGDPRSKIAPHHRQASLFEVWDGPAALVFTDGRLVGATRDRNGLRPLRLSEDQLMIGVASELGVFDFDDPSKVHNRALAPGEIFIFDPLSASEWPQSRIQNLIADFFLEFKEDVTVEKVHFATQPHEVSGAFLADGAAVQSMEQLLDPGAASMGYFGFFKEGLGALYNSVVTTGLEPVGSMGNDKRLPLLSPNPTSFYDYFRQRFAQVTNPPIDPVREACLFSMSSPFGAGARTGQRKLVLPYPVLLEDELSQLCNGRQVVQCQISYPRNLNLDAKVDGFCDLIAQTINAISIQHAFILITDQGVDSKNAAYPALLAAAALHQRLVQSGQRQHIGIIVATGQVRHSHDLACLFSLGVDGVCPSGLLSFCRTIGHKEFNQSPLDSARNARKALLSGLSKAMSRCGMSQFYSYKSAAAVDVIGLSQDLCSNWLGQVQGRFGRIGLVEAIREQDERMDLFGRLVSAPQERRRSLEGLTRWSSFGEKRGFNPDTITALRTAVLRDSILDYQRYSQILELQDKQGLTIRGLLALKFSRTPLPISNVESQPEILGRFSIGAMSIGALSPEAHQTLGAAARTLGIKSNSGEGGEQSTHPSSIRQVASGRFGVTLGYLLEASEIQIKIAQGAKPGEGGQLPGVKVTAEIAALRYTQAGVGLISPPPQHDIYSIEDLKQLIFDLRRVNPKARIGVKLVSSHGIGHIAVGVAKAGADMITIAGHDGGTGAAPVYSIYHVGEPWEIGLIEAHDELNANGLRHKVKLVVDGQIRSGRDVVLASILGADEFSLATAPLVALGCMLTRKCHLNTCPVGIATQDARLRGEFSGQAMHVVRLFRFLAEEVREILGRLGVRSLGELRAQRNLISIDTTHLAGHWKTRRMDVRQLLFASMSPYSKPKVLIQPETGCSAAEDALISRLEMTRTQTKDPGKTLELATTISNRDLTFGAALSAHLMGNPGHLNRGNTIRVTCSGTAGQSFGAFLASCVELVLNGAANDGVGKGLSGGKITIRSTLENVTEAPQSLAGNACFYGATSGTAFVGGLAGDRFAVRNSGATLVVDGIGDHGCEYMTGGVVVILGSSGKNLCAGMTGGRTFVFRSENRESDLELTISPDADLVVADLPADLALLHNLLVAHVQETKSHQAAAILSNWALNCNRFFMLIPSTSGVAPQISAVPTMPATPQNGPPNAIGGPVLPRPAAAGDTRLVEVTSR